MPLERLDFDNVDESDLTELLASGSPEGLRLDYKRDLYGNADTDKREALKDISAFANAFGGHLVIGVEESEGVPVSIPGVVGVNPDEVVLRLDQLVRTGVEPTILGLRIRAVRLQIGSHCFVLRIPRSWNPPHRVKAQNSNRFWVRNSGGSHEATIEELRTLFTLGADAFNRVHRFRDERLTEIRSVTGARPLKWAGRLILHVVPLVAVVSRWEVDLQAAHGLTRAFQPIGIAGTPRFNLDGLINERGGDQNLGYTQVFRNGALEATKADIVTERSAEGLRYIHARSFEKKIFDVLPGYLNGLRDLGVPPPLVILCTLENVASVCYRVRERDDEGFSEPNFGRDILFLPDCVVNEYASDQEYHRAMKPAFDALWNSADRASALTFANDGTWIGTVIER